MTEPPPGRRTIVSPLAGADLERALIYSGGQIPGYELLSVIGSGASSKVFRARQVKTDRLVALKVRLAGPAADPVLTARFETEAAVLGKLQHPNIVQILHCGNCDGRLFMAMELLTGEDLDQRLRRTGPLEERTSWAIARQTATALAHAATQGIIHRDVKPANLFLVAGPPGEPPREVPLVKVTDFGLAHVQRKFGTPDQRLTVPGELLGTPTYMAPEQYREAGEVDHRADIYALGATVLHALEGQPPFGGPTIWDVMARKMEPVPRFGPLVSAASAELLTAMLAPKPNDRIATYEELLNRIDRLLDGSEPAKARSPRKWRWWSW